jgi:uncharacterized membrane protein YfcA
MLLTIGLGIGLLLGLTGAGGSVFAVPLLVMLAGLPMAEAVGISLGAVAASTLYGSLTSGRQGRILWLPGLVLALSGALTAPVGKYLGNQLSESWLAAGFSLLAAVIALRMGWIATHQPDTTRVVRGSRFAQTKPPSLACSLSNTGQFELKPRCLSGLVMGGMGVGLLSGLFGVGGGFLIVPLLMALSAVSINQAVSTSLLIITLISSSGFVSHLIFNPAPDWSRLGWVAMGGVLGMVAGQALSQRIAGPRLQQLFAAGLLAVALVFVWEKTL